MWSDEINKKMEEAGESNGPAYNEKAWDNMKVLLDKHLPEKKKRRRFIYFLLPLALAGGIAFFITQKSTKKIPITDQKNTVVQPSSTTDKLINETDKTPKTITVSPKAQAGQEEISVKTTEENKVTAPGGQDNSPLLISKQPGKQKVQPVYSKNNNNKLAQTALKKKKNIRPTKTINDDNSIVADDPNVPNNKDRSIATNDVIANNTINPIVSDTVATIKSVAENETKKKDTIATAVVQPDIKKQKSKPSRGSRFSLNLSFGPDISSVGLDNPGRLELQYGLGASYAISKRLSVRTGLFAVRKIYTADSGNYKTPYTIHNLQKVDANCMVYEIPLTLMYNFPADKKHNWFIAGGFSSYLMKKETYGYHYKNPWGTPQYYKRTYKNENTHIFSVVNISGGYQYQFTDRFSIMAEPYIKIPASGIGVGKVKLNSAGVLFTVGFKPFVKRN